MEQRGCNERLSKAGWGGLEHVSLDEATARTRRVFLALNINHLRRVRRVGRVQEQRLHAVVRRDRNGHADKESSDRVLHEVKIVRLRTHAHHRHAQRGWR